MTRLLSFILVFISLNQAEAASPYIFVCKSAQMTLSLQRNLILLNGNINGWQEYLGLIDYKVQKNGQEYSGTIDTDITWRKDPRPGYNAFVAGVMEKDQATRLKRGLETSSVGFAGIESRDEIQGQFKATWKVYRTPETLNELDLESDELVCQMQ
ncbi:MAG: hypothetical protein IPM97_02515 [Bdellovibrionaceae bacterium]|nr:hypothetical protein [Pseudobdellovibrionaceae bacterium]